MLQCIEQSGFYSVGELWGGRVDVVLSFLCTKEVKESFACSLFFWMVSRVLYGCYKICLRNQLFDLPSGATESRATESEGQVSALQECC